MLKTLHWILLIALWQQTTSLMVKRSYKMFQTKEAHEIMRIAKSAEMSGYIRDDVDPCHDFYSYACGNWHRLNPAILDRSTSSFDVIEDAYYRKVEKLLNAPKRTSESDMDRKVKYFYESCMDKKELELNYRQRLLSLIEEFGGMPALKGKQWQANKFDWLDVTAKILRNYNVNIILGAVVASDLRSSDVNRIYIGQIDELLKMRLKGYALRKELKTQMDLQHVLGMSSELATKTALEMLRFERKLAIGVTDPLEGLSMEDKTKLRLLDDMTDSYKPTMNFTRFVTNWLGYKYHIPVYEYVESYLENLQKVIEETPKHVVANYIMWELLQVFRMEPKKKHDKHSKKCMEWAMNYFSTYIDNMVYRQLLHQNNRAVEDILQLWTELKHAFEETIQSDTAKWMSESTRDKALEKLSAITLEITSYESEDFGKYFGALVISNNNFMENIINLHQQRARNHRQKLHETPKSMETEDSELSFTPSYQDVFQKVFIPVSLLQPRFLWDEVYPQAFKYATLGNMITHELSHAFDDSSRKYDASGELNNWWDRNSTDSYAFRKECLRQQYGKFEYAGKKLAKTNDQDENIADNMGLRIAFNAYQQWLVQHHQNVTLLQQETLPNLDLTPRQLFFLSIAQMWCEDDSPLQQMMATTDTHAPGNIRVLGMVSNMAEFSLEFKCPVGSKMNPHEKCNFF